MWYCFDHTYFIVAYFITMLWDDHDFTDMSLLLMSVALQYMFHMLRYRQSRFTASHSENSIETIIAVDKLILRSVEEVKVVIVGI